MKVDQSAISGTNWFVIGKINVILVKAFIIFIHRCIEVLNIEARRKNLICMLKQKILNILEFRVKTTEIAIGLAIALAIGATLGLGIHIHT